MVPQALQFNLGGKLQGLDMENFTAQEATVSVPAATARQWR
jgi:hypothetical protein